MDDRLLELTHLLAPGTTFDVDGVPDDIRLPFPLGDREPAAAYLGWKRTAAELPDLERYQFVALFGPRGDTSNVLRMAGFTDVLAYSVLPSARDPRWMIPLTTAKVASRGLDFLAEYGPRTRFKKMLLRAIARAGHLGLLGDTLVLGRRSRSAFERQIEERMQLGPVSLAIKTGSPSKKRKPTVQIVTKQGRIAGFAKLATSAEARASLVAERRCLERLSRAPGLGPSIPRSLHAFDLAGAYVSVLSAGPTEAGPTTYGEAHRAFLRRLAAATRRDVPFQQSRMWQAMESALAALRPRLTPGWFNRLTAALGTLQQTLGPTTLRLAMAHRDFGPWNTRRRGAQELFVLDWEGGQDEAVPFYDFFNFHFWSITSNTSQASRVYRDMMTAFRRWHAEDDSEDIPRLFLTFLADHVLRRLTNASHPYDARTARVLSVAADLFDTHGEWAMPGEVSRWR